MSIEAVRAAARAASAAEASVKTIADAQALKQLEGVFAQKMLDHIGEQMQQVDTGGGFHLLASVVMMLEVLNSKPMGALELISRLAGFPRPDIFDNYKVRGKGLEGITEVRRAIALQPDGDPLNLN